MGISGIGKFEEFVPCSPNADIRLTLHLIKILAGGLFVVGNNGKPRSHIFYRQSVWITLFENFQPPFYSWPRQIVFLKYSSIETRNAINPPNHLCIQHISIIAANLISRFCKVTFPLTLAAIPTRQKVNRSTAIIPYEIWLVSDCLIKNFVKLVFW